MMPKTELCRLKYTNDIHTRILNEEKVKIKRGSNQKQHSFPRVIYPRPTYQSCCSRTCQESSSDVTSSDSASNACNKVCFNVEKKNVSNQHHNKFNKHKKKKLKGESKTESPSDRSLTLSVESSPFMINTSNHALNRGTSTHSICLNVNHTNSCCSTKISSSSSDHMSKPKSRRSRPHSRTCRNNPDYRHHKSHSIHHNHLSLKARPIRYHKRTSSSDLSSEALTSSSSCTRRQSEFREMRHRSKRYKTYIGDQKHNKYCSKHRTKDFFLRKRPYAFDFSDLLIRNNDGVAEAISSSSICQMLSPAEELCRPQASEELGCGCTPSKPCANSEFCEGCNANLQHKELGAAYSEPTICNSCNYNHSMDNNALKSQGLVYSDLPIRYDTHLGEFLDDDSPTPVQAVTIDEKEMVRDDDCQNKISWENCWIPASDKTSKTYPTNVSSTDTDNDYLPNIKLLSFDYNDSRF